MAHVSSVGGGLPHGGPGAIPGPLACGSRSAV